MKVIVKQLGNGIKNIIINDPKTYNSLSFKTLNELLKVFKILDKDNNTKVIILEGSGKGFSAGHNLKEVRGYKNRAFSVCKTNSDLCDGNKKISQDEMQLWEGTEECYFNMLRRLTYTNIYEFGYFGGHYPRVPPVLLPFYITNPSIGLGPINQDDGPEKSIMINRTGEVAGGVHRDKGKPFVGVCRLNNSLDSYKSKSIKHTCNFCRYTQATYQIASAFGRYLMNQWGLKYGIPPVKNIDEAVTLVHALYYPPHIAAHMSQ